jgi:hypothetical protein
VYRSVDNTKTNIDVVRGSCFLLHCIYVAYVIYIWLDAAAQNHLTNVHQNINVGGGEFLRAFKCGIFVNKFTLIKSDTTRMISANMCNLI